MNFFNKKIVAQYGGKKAFVRHVYYTLLHRFFSLYRRYSKPPMDTDRVIFVCKGNICRSALAHSVYQTQFEAKVVSCGLDTTPSQPANPRIQKIAKTLGYDMSEHRTTRIDQLDIKANDLLVCMEPRHVQAVKYIAPNANIVLLGLMLESPIVYIHDPFTSIDPYANRVSKKIVEATLILGKALKNRQ